METFSPDDLLTPAEVAAMLRCSRRSVIRYTHRTERPLKVEKHSKRRFMFRREDVENFRHSAV